MFATNEGRQENADLLHLYLGEWMATQRVAELYRSAQAARIPLTPVNTMAQIDTDPQLRSRSFLVDTADGLRVPGAGFTTDQGWWGLRRPAPALGEHDNHGWPARHGERSEPTEPDAGADWLARPEPAPRWNPGLRLHLGVGRAVLHPVPGPPRGRRDQVGIARSPVPVSPPAVQPTRRSPWPRLGWRVPVVQLRQAGHDHRPPSPRRGRDRAPDGGSERRGHRQLRRWRDGGSRLRGRRTPGRKP